MPSLEYSDRFATVKPYASRPAQGCAQLRAVLQALADPNTDAQPASVQGNAERAGVDA